MIVTSTPNLELRLLHCIAVERIDGLGCVVDRSFDAVDKFLTMQSPLRLTTTFVAENEMC